MSFDHKKIEQKWQKYWEANNIFKTDIDSTKDKFYALDMFPYPSGAGLHVGHPEGYTATDIISRMKKMQGYEVLHPMGFDAFGLPAEQYAIQTGNSPAKFTKKNIEIFKKQLKSLGFNFDWSREVNTTDPEYFKHTQWAFLQMYKHGLAELKEIEVNWCEELNTVLANEEVLEDENGNPVSERGSFSVIKKNMKQWVIKITKYVDRMFEGLKDLDWPDSIKRLQMNWFYEQDENGNYLKDKIHLRDWIFARQRYWGEPFPIIHLENGETYLVPEQELPLKLPEIDNYSFSKNGKPALANSIEWANVEVDGIKGERDLNTMPQWAGSCWYYIGYILKDGDKFLDLNDPKAKARLDKWLPVDLYIGGQEHAVLHLIYARFWHMFLNDIGITSIKEPFKKLFNQGMIQGPDGSKMSKSKGNVVNPNDIVEKYGADTLRLYEMFMGSLDDDKPWSEDGLQASRNWLARVYRFFDDVVEYGEPSNKIKVEFNKMIELVTNLYEELKFNVAISKMMVFINEVYKDRIISKEIGIGFLQLLSCVAPHISDELYSQVIGEEKTIYNVTWPKLIDANEVIKDRKIVIQINGKVRKELVNPELLENPSEDELKKFVSNELPQYISYDSIRKIIFIKGIIINVVI